MLATVWVHTSRRLTILRTDSNLGRDERPNRLGARTIAVPTAEPVTDLHLAILLWVRWTASAGNCAHCASAARATRGDLAHLTEPMEWRFTQRDVH